MADHPPSPPSSSPKAASELDFVEGLSSSPHPSGSVPSRDGSKLRKPPTITPRTFRRFFTPRSASGRVSKVSASRRALFDITSPAINRIRDTNGRGAAAIDGFVDIAPVEKENTAIGVVVGPKRRKILISPDTSPDSSPLKKPRRTSVDKDIEAETDTVKQQVKEEPQDDDEGVGRRIEESDRHVDGSEGPRTVTEPVPVRRARLSGSTGRILQRSIGPGAGSGIGFGRRDLKSHCAGWYSLFSGRSPRYHRSNR